MNTREFVWGQPSRISISCRFAGDAGGQPAGPATLGDRGAVWSLVKSPFSQGLLVMPADLVPLPPPDAPLTGPVFSADVGLKKLWDIALGDLKDSSKQAYRTRLAGFTNWLGIDVETLPLLIVSSSSAAFHAQLYAYRDHLKKSPLKAATRNLTLAAISRVVSKLHDHQLVGWTLSVRLFKARKYKDTAGPPEEVVRQMLKVLLAPGTCPIRAARDTAIIRLAVSLGLRRSEIVQLDLEDISREVDGSIRIAIREKGGDEPRFLAVPGRTKDALVAWLSCRRGFTTPDSAPVTPAPCFIRLTHAALKGRRADRLSDEGVAHLLDRVRRKAGVARRVLPHSLRHRAISSLIESGAPLADAVVFARHSDPKTTMIYWDNAQEAAKKSAETLDQRF